MKMSRFVRAALVACVVAMCVCGLVACSGSNSASGGVAATVNGTEIPEQKVTDQIEQIREQSGLSEEDQWGQFLVENDMTPSSVREQIIDTLTEQEVIKQAASELGITVESSEIDEYVNNMKQNYDGDEAWNKALEQAGFTEEAYRETIQESLYEQKVGDHFEEEAEITDEDLVKQAQTYAAYYNGAKRSSHILFGVEDTTDEAAVAEAQKQAEDVLARIKDGSLDFADAASQYSTDDGSKDNGGDVGWDVLNSFVDEYTTALESLELDQVSDPVTSQYGVHIIKVTEVYNAPEDATQITSMDQIPEAFRSSIEDMAKSVKANSGYTDWLDEQKEKADIVVNDMPSGLPYDIDLTPYQSDASADESGETAVSTDAATVDSTTVDATTVDATTTDGTATVDGTATGSETVDATGAAATAEGAATDAAAADAAAAAEGTATDAAAAADAAAADAAAADAAASSSSAAQ